MPIVSDALEPDLPAGLLIGEDFAAPNEDLEVRSPYTGEVVARLPAAGASDVETAVRVATEHLLPPPASERALVLERAATLMRERSERFARTMAVEAGKPLVQARIEVERGVDTLVFSAVEARRLAGDVIPMESSGSGLGKIAFTIREPIGVVAAISPFNFPLNLAAHKVAPAIAAGCPVILKPAEKTPLTGLLLAEVLLDAGLPPGFMQVIFGDGAAIGGALVEHPDVPMISFTGSNAVGWAIRERAPRKRVALELGNSTPVIVAADADLERAADRISYSGYTFAGQSCISVQRVYAHHSVRSELEELLAARVDRLPVGDPLDEATHVGPVIDEGARERLTSWIDEDERSGAEVLSGAELEDGHLRPTLLSGITPRMRVGHEEAFGPIVGVAGFEEPEEAIDLANSTVFGLQAGVFTARVDRAIDWARRLRFGGVVINETPTFRADQQPYGGLKESGNVKEGPRYTVEDMTEERLVVLQLGD